MERKKGIGWKTMNKAINKKHIICEEVRKGSFDVFKKTNMVMIIGFTVMVNADWSFNANYDVDLGVHERTVNIFRAISDQIYFC